MFKSKLTLTYANVTATVALVLSMSGGAIAATHYLITSTKQISPKVLRSLKGNAGVTGAPGLTGKEGLQGKEGPQGKEGSQGKEGQAGKGEPGSKGEKGEAGSALAYAHVKKTGELATGETKNVGKVVHEGEDIFCLSGIKGELHNVVATIDQEEAESIPGITATLGRGAGVTPVCPEGTQVTVETFEVVGGMETEVEWESSEEGFFVAVN